MFEYLYIMAFLFVCNKRLPPLFIWLAPDYNHIQSIMSPRTEVVFEKNDVIILIVLLFVFSHVLVLDRR